MSKYKHPVGHAAAELAAVAAVDAVSPKKHGRHADRHGNHCRHDEKRHGHGHRGQRRQHHHKLLTLGLLAAGGYALWKKYTEAEGDRKLWADVTDSVK